MDRRNGNDFKMAESNKILSVLPVISSFSNRIFSASFFLDSNVRNLVFISIPTSASMMRTIYCDGALGRGTVFPTNDGVRHRIPQQAQKCAGAPS
jgi:hypothetical protein